MKRLLMLAGFSLLMVTGVVAQNGEVINDTLYVVNDVNKPIEFSKALGKYVYIRNVVPADLPEKSRKIEIVSSVSTELDLKEMQVVNKVDIILPLYIFTEKYYTLYIKKNNATIVAKKLIIR